MLSSSLVYHNTHRTVKLTKLPVKVRYLDCQLWATGVKLSFPAVSVAVMRRTYQQWQESCDKCDVGNGDMHCIHGVSAVGQA